MFGHRGLLGLDPGRGREPQARMRKHSSVRPILGNKPTFLEMNHASSVPRTYWIHVSSLCTRSLKDAPRRLVQMVRLDVEGPEAMSEGSRHLALILRIYIIE